MFIKSFYKKILINTFAQFGSKAISVVLSVISVGLLARYLGTSGYGNYTLVFTYLSFFSLIADLGFNVTLVREFSGDNNLNRIVKSTYLNLKLILVLTSIIISIISLLFFPYPKYLKVGILIGVFAVAVGNLMSYGTSVLQSKLRLDLVALTELVTKIVTVVVSVYFIHIKASFYYIISSILIGNIVGLCFSLYFIRDYLQITFSIDHGIVQKIIRVALPVGITGVLSLFYFKVDTILLSVMKTSSDVGIYGLAYNVLENILMLWGLVMASIFPLLSHYFGKSDAPHFKDLLIKTLLLLAGMSLFFIFLGNTFDFLIMRILGGSKFFSSMVPFKILLFSIPFFFLNNVFYSIIVVFGKTKYLIMPLIFSLAINVLLNIIIIPKYGYNGASYVTVATEMINSIVYVTILLLKFRTEYIYWGLSK